MSHPTERGTERERDKETTQTETREKTERRPGEMGRERRVGTGRQSHPAGRGEPGTSRLRPCCPPPPLAALPSPLTPWVPAQDEFADFVVDEDEETVGEGTEPPAGPVEGRAGGLECRALTRGRASGDRRGRGGDAVGQSPRTLHAHRWRVPWVGLGPGVCGVTRGRSSPWGRLGGIRTGTAVGTPGRWGLRFRLSLREGSVAGAGVGRAGGSGALT